eukprot:scaffold20692_cov97-Cylindrotheca_fusiformis.AAC.2
MASITLVDQFDSCDYGRLLDKGRVLIPGVPGARLRNASMSTRCRSCLADPNPNPNPNPIKIVKTHVISYQNCVAVELTAISVPETENKPIELQYFVFTTLKTLCAYHYQHD